MPKAAVAAIRPETPDEERARLIERGAERSRSRKGVAMLKDARGMRGTRPSACIVCSHPDRGRIEALVCGGASQHSVAIRFGGGLNKDNLSRHFKHHVSLARRAELLAGPAKVEQLANHAAEESRSLLDYLAVVRSVLLATFLNAAEAGDRLGVATLSGRLLDALRELGRLTGELREVSGITINQNVLAFFGSPEFMRLQEGLLDLARAHPAARADIVALLRNLDAAPALAPPDADVVGGGRLLEGEAAA